MAYADEVLADSPLVYYRLDETSGTTLTDSSGNARHGSYSGSPSLGAAGLIADGTSVDFSGSGQYATGPSGAWLGTAHTTVEALINFDPLGTKNITIAARRDPGSGFLAQAWQFRVLSGGQLSWLVFTSVSVVKELVGTTVLQSGSVYHVAGTFDGTELRLYLNGSLEASVAHSGSLNSATTSPPRIAAEFNSGGAGELFNGRIDEVAIYGTALSPTRIATHSAAAWSTLTAPLTASGSLTAALSVVAELSAPLAAETTLAAALGGGSRPVAATLSAETTLTASLAVAQVVGTSETYANDSYNYDGVGEVDLAVPVAPTPARVRRSKVRRVHQSLPAPTLVDGRPT